MYTINKTFKFSASHQLHGLPTDHPCGRLHGHNYTVDVEVRRERLDKTGFVIDFLDLKPFGAWLDATFDHRHLNDVVSQPTSEVLAKFIYDTVKMMHSDVSAVRVSETPTTWAEYRP